MSVHIGLLIILGLTLTQVVTKKEEAVEIQQSRNVDQPLDEISDQLGEQLIKQVENPPPVSDPALQKLDGDGGGAGTNFDLPNIGDDFLSKFPDPIVSTNIAPAGENGSPAFSGSGGFTIGRAGGTKRGLLGRFGGTPVTETAVTKALKWLQKNQLPDGSWSLVGPYSNGSSSDNPAAATAMALLAFQGYGDTHIKGDFKDTVKKGWAALIKMQNADGLFSSRKSVEDDHQRYYCHAQCTIAICELVGMTGDPAMKGPAQKAIDYLAKNQDPKGGGWRYGAAPDSDTSVTGWVLMALMSGKMANLNIPKQTFDGITKYLDAAQYEDGKRYWYRPMEKADDGTMTAEGLLMRQYLGWERNDPRLAGGVDVILKKPISFDNEINVYYWYYATQVCHHMEGDAWEKWNSVLSKAVPGAQVKDGNEAGSWDPSNDTQGRSWGRLYVTCLSTYLLEVYYRHLPIYDAKVLHAER
jgi:hypothetical protein